MVPVFQDLMGTTDHATARLMFRSIVNPTIRIAIMRSLLEKSPNHKNKGPHYDELIDEFGALGRIRNKYAHGLWYTLEGNSRVFIEEETDTAHSFLQKREVTDKELDEVTRRFSDFLGKLLDYRRRGTLARVLASSPHIAAPPASESSRAKPPPEAS
jgi:hypothetical protein